jgi:hypothetical protein
MNQREFAQRASIYESTHHPTLHTVVNPCFIRFGVTVKCVNFPIIRFAVKDVYSTSIALMTWGA